MARRLNYRIEIYKDSSLAYRWRMKAHNGSVIADGAEGYARKGNARRAAERLVNVISDGHYDIVEVE